MLTKKNTSYGANMQIKTLKVSFSLFFVPQRLFFFEYDSDHLEELFLCTSFGCN